MGVDPSGRSLDSLHYCRGGWVCRYDLATACVLALALDAPGYRAYHVIGAREARKRYDVDRTENEFGMAFETRFERYTNTADSAPGAN